ncbi:LacI family transcriptional regulator [Hungatella hathewayi]|uniref:LacI family transcriptional regulator n=1 Tax=Hungatella hathewayi TaxID=154046 RepID=A0A3E2WW49_9FIRM|nr:LacI family transcriptional regulator [Faecalicatena contorta]RGC32064.1 LacI family transcriptional regulator [Hungatella hathewayi]
MSINCSVSGGHGLRGTTMTITEIAKMAGVSVSAVSRYLNDGYISEEKRRKIKAVIDKTGYRPSKQAQILRTKRSKVIGVILPKISSESIARVADGISSVLSEKGYQMLLASTENNPKKEIEYLNLLKNNPVDGILFSASVYDRAHQEALKKLGIPIVIISQRFDDCACVYHDDYGAARAMTELLLESGKKKVAHIAVSQKDEAAGKSRTEGYKDAMKEYGLEVPEKMIITAGFNMEAGYESMKRLVNRCPELDAVFCATDTLAVGAVTCLKDMGRKIPEETAVAGIGHNRLSRVVTPRITTAHLFYRTSGIEAANMLLELIENEANIYRQTKLGYEVVKAESV